MGYKVMEKKRREDLDILKGIGIFLMVFDHVSSMFAVAMIEWHLCTSIFNRSICPYSLLPADTFGNNAPIGKRLRKRQIHY